MTTGGTDGRVPRWKPIAAAAAAALLVSTIGGTLTDLGPWYQGLRQPSWKPPDAAFPIVWTTIFALAALSAAFAWQNARSQATREWIIGLFALNGFLNILWSVLFFRLKRPDWALLEVGLLWLSILLLIVVTGRQSRLAGALLVPYIVWVTLAAYLNFEIVRLNP